MNDAVTRENSSNRILVDRKASSKFMIPKKLEVGDSFNEELESLREEKQVIKEESLREDKPVVVDQQSFQKRYSQGRVVDQYRLYKFNLLQLTFQKEFNRQDVIQF